MAYRSPTLAVVRAILSQPALLRVKPSVSWFLLQYLMKFSPRVVGGNVFVHSHLPPLNSAAYGRFVTEHLLGAGRGPSHAQIGLTNACPQNCEYCYSRDTRGKVLDTPTILSLIRTLKEMGVFWLGFTGGEPLLNKDLVRITEAARDGCAVKLFTTGCTLTQQMAFDLRDAGLCSVSISLDHWEEEHHDAVRRYPGAYRTALRAIEMFLATGAVHVGVSAVLSGEMIRNREVEKFLDFLTRLDVHEAWLSEEKPSMPELWTGKPVLTEADRLHLVAVQDRHNKRGGLTVNYLGHFEGKEHFGCTAGNKMVYVDACGNVRPCVFLPASLGNVRERPLREIYTEMRNRFPTEGECFMNRNLGTLQKYCQGQLPLDKHTTEQMLEEIRFSPLARFFQLHHN